MGVVVPSPVACHQVIRSMEGCEHSASDGAPSGEAASGRAAPSLPLEGASGAGAWAAAPPLDPPGARPPPEGLPPVPGAPPVAGGAPPVFWVVPPVFWGAPPVPDPRGIRSTPV